ncbi:MAG: NTP transferase domain-containing protein [Clostridia bacterium]|nr:NTP transferase domain-containing protein [Clostridia bacterium]
MTVDNAIILAAGTGSRFTPLSFERHKALTVVRGEVLIERQIEQLKEAGINDIYIVVGYKAEQFEYLRSKYGVRFINNNDYMNRNNHASIWAARHILNDSYVCSSDNYFSVNPFEKKVDDAYYAAEFASGKTKEWCMTEGEDGYVSRVTIGGENAWYMYGHTFWSRDFSGRFIDILEKEYNDPETAGKLWEVIYADHLDVLKMRIKKYEPGVIYEFDTMDELREFDGSYITDTRSGIIKKISEQLGVPQSDVINIRSLNGVDPEAIGFEFDCPRGSFKYLYESGTMHPRR